MAEHTHLQDVRDDYQSGLDSGVAGTPTFFINGMRHEGFFRYENLLAAIEKARS
jgi:protein-disulfide isomerase